jgi:hypothetical protein
MMVVASLHAQFIPRSLHSGNQPFIEEAVKSGIFLVRQSYQLKNTTNNTLYGWSHAEHFGYTISLGIKAENGYYLAPQALAPWNYDRKFANYNDRRYYLPFVSESRYRSWTDSVFSPLPYSADQVHPLVDSPFGFVRDSVFDNRGLEADFTGGRKEGWLVWVVSSDSTDIAAPASLSLLVYRNELTFEPGESACKIKDPTTVHRILGGLYVVPHTTGIGKVSFRLSGFLNKKEDDWQVVRLSEPVDKEKTYYYPPTKDGLTPILKK